MRSSIVLFAVSMAALGCTRESAPTPTGEQRAALPSAARVTGTTAEKVTATPVAKTTPASEPHASAKEGGSCAGMDCGGCDLLDHAAKDAPRRDVPSDARWTTISVAGMTCGGCESRIIAEVGTTEGVLKVEADAELGRVRVATLDDDKAIGAAKSKIAKLGYRVVD